MEHLGRFGIVCLDNDVSCHTLCFIWTMEACKVVLCGYSVGWMFYTYQMPPSPRWFMFGRSLEYKKSEVIFGEMCSWSLTVALNHEAMVWFVSWHVSSVYWVRICFVCQGFWRFKNQKFSFSHIPSFGVLTWCTFPLLVSDFGEFLFLLILTNCVLHRLSEELFTLAFPELSTWKKIRGFMAFKGNSWPSVHSEELPKGLFDREEKENSSEETPSASSSSRGFGPEKP